MVLFERCAPSHLANEVGGEDLVEMACSAVPVDICGLRNVSVPSRRRTMLPHTPNSLRTPGPPRRASPTPTSTAT